jgi:ATP-dependent Lon protease
MYRIMTKGYEAKEKVIISKNFLLPKIREQVAFKEDDIIIPDQTLDFIINEENITKGEEGVRNLKRCLEIIHTKLNLFRLMKPDKNIFSKELDLSVSFPFTVTSEHVKKLIEFEPTSQSLLAMYI